MIRPQPANNLYKHKEANNAWYKAYGEYRKKLLEEDPKREGFGPGREGVIGTGHKKANGWQTGDGRTTWQFVGRAHSAGYPGR